MSNLVNDLIVEDLGERVDAMIDYLTPANVAEFEQYIEDGQIEDAILLVNRWENELPIMIDGRDEYDTWNHELQQAEY